MCLANANTLIDSGKFDLAFKTFQDTRCREIWEIPPLWN
jgi:hypothetical protein